MLFLGGGLPLLRPILGAPPTLAAAGAWAQICCCILSVPALADARLDRWMAFFAACCAATMAAMGVHPAAIRLDVVHGLLALHYLYNKWGQRAAAIGVSPLLPPRCRQCSARGLPVLWVVAQFVAGLLVFRRGCEANG